MDADPESGMFDAFVRFDGLVIGATVSTAVATMRLIIAKVPAKHTLVEGL